MIEIKPPNNMYDVMANEDTARIFLAGSIEMGAAEEWQRRFVNDMVGKNVIILNPRRDDWDSRWEQSASNFQFSQQVNWELDALESADTIVFYFDPNTKAPITLMELGMFAGRRHCIVCCPPGYWRRGNVEIVCMRNNIEMLDSYEEMIDAVHTYY